MTAYRHRSRICVLPAADVYIYDDASHLDEVPAAGTPPAALGSVPAWKRLLWEGGHPSDAFLTAASAQVTFGARIAMAGDSAC